MIFIILNFLGSVLVSYINPESYFFGEKLVGVSAIIYLLTGGIAGMIIVYFLFKEKTKGEILSVIYFGYFFVESLITNLSLGFSISPLFKLGLVLSIILLVIRKMIYRQGSKLFIQKLLQTNPKKNQIDFLQLVQDNEEDRFLFLLDRKVIVKFLIDII